MKPALWEPEEPNTRDRAASQGIYPVADDHLSDEDAAIFDRITGESERTFLLAPNYMEGEAVRHAALDCRGWVQEGGVPYYRHRSLAVLMQRQQRTLDVDEVNDNLSRIRESTVLTERIAMGLWNLRRNSQQLCRNGSVAILMEEFLQWRGIKKHSRAAVGTRRTDGWRHEDIQAVADDLDLAATFYVRGKHTIKVKGRYKDVEVDCEYIRVTVVWIPTT